jgi:hypothetical protein
MNFLEKMISNPDYGPRTGAPLARLAFGLGLLFFDLFTLSTGSIRISKAGAGTFIHYSDHPLTFVLTCSLAAVGGIWGIFNARKRYLMHAE